MNYKLKFLVNSSSKTEKREGEDEAVRECQYPAESIRVCPERRQKMNWRKHHVSGGWPRTCSVRLNFELCGS